MKRNVPYLREPLVTSMDDVDIRREAGYRPLAFKQTSGQTMRAPNRTQTHAAYAEQYGANSKHEDQNPAVALIQGECSQYNNHCGRHVRNEREQNSWRVEHIQPIITTAATIAISR